jgi:hypothetical protein
MDRRRFLLTSLAGAVGWSRAAVAQQPRNRTIGFLGATVGPNSATEAFRQGLKERGWTEGANLTIEDRWAEGKTERFVDLATELRIVDLARRIRLPVISAWRELPDGGGA